jgi:hypothetical protein
MMRDARKNVLGASLLMVAVACVEDEGGQIVEVSTSECASGRKWVGGDEESPLMHPGRDCDGCHADEDEGPRFHVGGTVYSQIREPDDCLGVEGVTVEITDAMMREFSLVSNEAGNFYLEVEEAQVEFPISVRAIRADRSIAMTAMQTTGRCATCHTQMGANMAPGRIIVP